MQIIDFAKFKLKNLLSGGLENNLTLFYSSKLSLNMFLPHKSINYNEFVKCIFYIKF